jgi:ankyrin repeat protein
MHIAAKHGHYLIVKYLMEINANPAIQNRDGLTAYDYADESRRQIEI